MDSRFPKETSSLQWVTQRRMASIRSFGGCHSIQLSYERVGADFTAVSAPSPKDGEKLRMRGGLRVAIYSYFACCSEGDSAKDSRHTETASRKKSIGARKPRRSQPEMRIPLCREGGI